MEYRPVRTRLLGPGLGPRLRLGVQRLGQGPSALLRPWLPRRAPVLGLVLGRALRWRAPALRLAWRGRAPALRWRGVAHPNVSSQSWDIHSAVRPPHVAPYSSQADPTLVLSHRVSQAVISPPWQLAASSPHVGSDERQSSDSLPAGTAAALLELAACELVSCPASGGWCSSTSRWR